MIKEWQWKSENGHSFLHAGIGTQDAVGAPKPSEAIPLQEGLRLLSAKGIDRLWHIYLFTVIVRLLKRSVRKKRRHRLE